MTDDNRKGTLAAVGAVAVAIVSSACCWLPLLLLGLGLSGGAVAARFEAWRPVMLPLTFLLLATGWYFTLRPSRAVAMAGTGTCAIGADGEGAGCPPAGQGGFSVRRLNLVLLTLATVMTLAFAFFPSYVGSLFAGDDATATVVTETHPVVLGIEGMTCAGCEVAVTKRLENVPGVVVSDVDYTSGQATVLVPTGVEDGQLREAVEAAGYQVTDIKGE